MATVFDQTTYPLNTDTSFKPILGTKVDRMDDGTPRLRVLSNIKATDIECVFSPQSEAQAAAFETYLYSVAAIYLSIVHNTKVYEGFIDGESVDMSVSEGVLLHWSFTFIGKRV